MSAQQLLPTLSELVAHPSVRAFAILVAGMLLVRLISAAVHRRVVSSGSPHWALVVRKMVAYVGTTVVLLSTARALDIDLTALVATAGVATIAVGFAAQTSLSNLIAGLFLLVDRPFQVGDTVELEGRLGVVQEISLLSTLMRTFDSILVRWPNEVVLKSTITNYTRYPARRIDLRVGVAYGSDLVRARAVLLDAVSSLDRVLLEPAPNVVTCGFLDSAVDLEVRAWVAQPDFLAGRTDVTEAVHRALQDAGIEIPFPQLKLWRGDAP